MARLSPLLASRVWAYAASWQTGQTSQQAGLVVPEKETGQNRVLSTGRIFKNILIING